MYCPPPHFYHNIYLYWFVPPTYKIVPAPLPNTHTHTHTHTHIHRSPTSIHTASSMHNAASSPSLAAPPPHQHAPPRAPTAFSGEAPPAYTVRDSASNTPTPMGGAMGGSLLHIPTGGATGPLPGYDDAGVVNLRRTPSQILDENLRQVELRGGYVPPPHDSYASTMRPSSSTSSLQMSGGGDSSAEGGSGGSRVRKLFSKLRGALK